MTTPTGMPTVGSVDHSGAEGSGANKIHGSKWNVESDPDTNSTGAKQFQKYKETWVYVDGEPKGVMMFPEIPSWIPVAWADDIDGLDFDPSTPPDKRNKKVQLLRYNLLEYLKNAGVDTSKIKAVYIQGSGYSVLPRSTLDKYGKEITFDFTGNDMNKTRFYWPMGMPINMSYDRYVAVDVFINKPVPEVDNHRRITIDGEFVQGIPYHGTPERGGVRVYLDGRLAFVIKRNSLGDVGRVRAGEARWSLMKLLEANGIKHPDIGGIDVVSERDIYNMHRTRLAADVMKDPTFTTNQNASGEVDFGEDQMPVNAFLLYSKGHVPDVKPLPPLERDWQKGP